MKFNKQDREDYISYLKSEIENEESKPDSVNKFINVQHIWSDYNSMREWKNGEM